MAIQTGRKQKPVVLTPVPQQSTGREVILSVLSRASEDPHFLSMLGEYPHKALSEYYTLKPEEVAALISGDLQKIEEWCGKLDNRHATWLWCRLSQEKW